jgi:carboxyl-terminal processing protease
MFKRVLGILGLSCGAAGVLLLAVNFVPGVREFLLGDARQQANDFQSVLRLIHENYVSDTGTTYDELSTTALEELVRSLDPHSEFMVPREYGEFKEDTRQEFGGIGVQIEMRDKRLTVVAPIAGTPGDRAGLLRGDQFVRVGETSMEGLSLDECLDLLRGKPGTEVKLTVARPRTGETLEKTVVREIIRVESVRDARLINPDVGYVRLLQFAERTGAEFRNALESLEQQGMKALVLDLRDNPGGLLDVAVEVAEPFFNPGEVVVYTQGRRPESRDEEHARGVAGGRRTYPVAVLINSGSASASEIVAGALRDTGRGVLVGEKSFGKGSVQTIYSIRPGGPALRLTTALYYTPSGDVIHGKGIAPHIPVTLSAEEDRKLAVQRNRLPLMTNQEFRELFEFEPIEDRQLTAAVDLLRGYLAVQRLPKPADS